MIHDVDQLLRTISTSVDDHIKDMEPALKGTINFVYKLTGEKQNYYMKHRKDFCKNFPGIKIDPQDLAHEVNVLHVMHDAYPQNFPYVVFFDNSENFCVMTDVVQSGFDLADGFNNKKLLSEDFYALGKTVGALHFTLKNEHRCDRTNDLEIYNLNLDYKFGKNAHSAHIIDALNAEPKQMILGDLSPKNIGYNNSQFVFYDLEYSHQGNALYEAGFLISHIMLHYSDDEELANHVDAFKNGYTSSNAEIDVHSALLNKVVLGTMLYRIDNPLSQYSLNWEENKKNTTIHNIHCMITQKDINSNDVLSCIRYNSPV